MVRITFDPAKRAATLERRGLDFVDAGLESEGRHAIAPDQRFDYGELRFITVGELHGRLVVIVWTPRGNARRIISMRFGRDNEARRWADALGRPR